MYEQKKEKHKRKQKKNKKETKTKKKKNICGKQEKMHDCIKMCKKKKKKDV